MLICYIHVGQLSTWVYMEDTSKLVNVGLLLLFASQQIL